MPLGAGLASIIPLAAGLGLSSIIPLGAGVLAGAEVAPAGVVHAAARPITAVTTIGASHRRPGRWELVIRNSHCANEVESILADKHHEPMTVR